MIVEYADPILAIGSAFFFILLLPIIYTQYREKASTVPLHASVPTALVFLITVIVYAALGLWIASVVEAMQAVGWLFIAFQWIRYHSKFAGETTQSKSGRSMSPPPQDHH